MKGGLKRNLLLKLTNYKFNLLRDSYANLKNFLNAREEFFYQFINFTKKNYIDLLEAQYKQFQAFIEYEMYYKLELIISIITLSSKHKIRLKSLNIEEVKILANQGVKSYNDLIKIQALSLNLIMEKDNNSYYELASIFKEKEDQISNDLLTQLVPNLLNYGFVRIHNGNEDFEKDNYQLLCFLFEKGKLFSQGIFSVARVITFIRSELRYGTIEKAEQLLEESLKVITPAQKDSFQYLIESRIIFAKKDYKISLRKISTINPSDSIYYFPQYKIMLIKNYIMLADIDRLMAERENFYKYLNNQKNIQEDEKRRHKLFIKYTEYLTNARYEYLTDYMKKRIENALLQTSPYFSEKQWVRERWEELRILNS